MKHLPYFITESLFDTDIVEKSIASSILKDPNSRFWELIGIPPAGAEYVISEWDNIDDVTTTKLINIKSIANGLRSKLNNIEITKEFPVFDEKLSIVFGNLNLGSQLKGGQSTRPDPMTHGLYFNKIYCDSLNIDGYIEKLEGFNFVIDNKSVGIRGAVYMKWADCIKSLKGTTMTFTDESHSLITCTLSTELPKFNGLSTNAKFLNIYDPSLFDRFKSDFDKFLGPGTLTSNGVIKKLNSRNLIAMANNIKKYPTMKPFKPAGKVKDLINISGFNNLDVITLSSNNVEVKFVRPHTSEGDAAILRHARYLRINNMKEFRDISPETIGDWVVNCVTDDGWCMLVEKKYY